MGFGMDFTEEELAELKKIDIIYDKLLPKRNTDSKHLTATSLTHDSDHHDRIPVRDFFVSSAGSPSVARIGSSTLGMAAKWQMMLHEINGEVVVRGGQNIRNTRAVVNRILHWTIIFQQADRAAASISLGYDGGRALAREWVRGIVVYYQERMDQLFTQLDITAQEHACVQELGLPGLDGVDFVSRCVEVARTVITPVLITSPYFISIIRCCREMTLSLTVIQGLLAHISSHTRLVPPPTAPATSDGHRSPISILILSEDFLKSLRTPLWLFRFILLFLGALDLQQSPHREFAISELHLDYAIHCIISLVAGVEAKREGATTSNASSSIVANTSCIEVHDTLDALVLGHIKNACLSRFPPSETLELLVHEEGVREDAQVSDSSDSLITRCGPVLRQLLVDYPTFMESTGRFAERNKMSSWGTSLMLVQLFCWDVNTSPSVAAQAHRQIRYHVPKPMGSFPHGSTVLHALTRKALHPLFSALFSTTAPTSDDDGLEGGGAIMQPTARSPGHVHSASDQTLLPPLAPFEERVTATLLTLATWLQTLSFSAGPRMPRWTSLDVGDQVMREFHLGEDCFKRAVNDILHSVLATVLAQVEKECVHSSSAETAAAAAETEESASELGTAVLRYLLRVECMWNALTGHIIELHPSAFDDIRAMGAKTLPAVSTAPTLGVATDEKSTTVRGRYETSLFVTCRYLFYDAVQNVMSERWPKRYADLLTDPLLQSAHLYLLRVEKTNRWGGRLRPVAPSGAPGRKARVSRSMPSSEEASRERAPHPGAAVPNAVVLTSEEDMHSALRLVRCIKNRDHFVHRYIITARERLLTRPAPDIISDAELEGNKKRHEREAEQFLTTWLGDLSLLKPVRELYTNYSTQSALFAATPESPAAETEALTKGVRLTTTILDWRLWGDKESKPTTAPRPSDEKSVAPLTSAAESLSQAGQAYSVGTSETATLPLPLDVLAHLEKVEHAYNAQHLSRTLRWDWSDHAYTTFSLAYPKDGGRCTTVHGTLLLHRLFLAIAGHGRCGVEMETLAKRAGVDERRIAAMLKPCLDRDKLLVRISGGGDGDGASAGAGVTALSGKERIALNYDYVRSPKCPRIEYTYWPNAERRRVTASTVGHDSTISKRRNMIKTSIMQVMKHVQRIAHDDLYETVREKNSGVFELTVRNFKQEIEILIGQEFMARSDKNANEYVFRT